MTEVIFDLISAVVLAVGGICTVYTGIKGRKKQKANIAFTVILIVCGILCAVSPFIKPYRVSDTPFEENDVFAYMLYAFTYAALICLHTAIYHLSIQKSNNRLQMLVSGFSALVAFMLLLSAVMMFVSVGINIFMMIPKY